MIVDADALTVGEVADMPRAAKHAVLRALGWVLVDGGWRWVGRSGVLS